MDHGTAVCITCGQEFTRKRPKQIACSVVCRNRIPRETGGIRAKVDIEPRICPICETEYKPVRENQRACTRRCRDRLPDKIAAQRAYDADPGRRALQNLSRHVEVNPERRAFNLKSNLRRYGLTVDTWQAMVERQGDCCAICGSPPNPGTGPATQRLHIDHDHVTGRNRALLCNNCNRGLGYFKDDPVLLRAAADYIDRYRE